MDGNYDGNKRWLLATRATQVRDDCGRLTSDVSDQRPHDGVFAICYYAITGMEQIGYVGGVRLTLYGCTALHIVSTSRSD